MFETFGGCSMKRLLTTLLCVIFLFQAAAFVLDRAVVFFWNYATREAAGNGVLLQRLQISHAELGLSGVRWHDVGFDVDIQGHGEFSGRRTVSVKLRRLTLAPAGIFPLAVTLRGSGLQMASHVLADVLDEPHDQEEFIQQGVFRLRFEPGLENPRRLRRKLGGLFQDTLKLVYLGEARLDLTLSAVALFKMHRETFKIPMKSEKRSGRIFVTMPAGDLQRLSQSLDERLTPQELSVLSERPFLAPQLFKIRNTARHEAYQAKKKNPAIPKDAYRHVLWSYLLTREFGERIAQEVTDAHEKDQVVASTQAQHEMDYHNNRIGRGYAKKNVPQNTLLEKVLTDTAVIRSTR